MPYAVVGEHRFDLPHEMDGVLEVVEHRDRRHDPGRLLREATIGVGREEFGDQRDGVAIEVTELVSRGIDSYTGYVGCRITLEQSGVVAADVENDISTAQLNESFQVAHLVREMRDHGLV
jgi:hypothetical protein